MEEILSEIIRKECERYRLLEFGLLSSVEDGVKKLLPLVQSRYSEMIKDDFNAFSLWRKDVLRCFYTQLDYTLFVIQHKNDTSFLRFIFYMQKRLLNVMLGNQERVEIDKNLAVPGRTIAFKTSKLLVADTIALWISTFSASITPEELEEACFGFCKTYFPLGLDKLLYRLKKNDSEFWMELFLLVKKIVASVVDRNILTVSYKKEIEQDVWEKTSFLLQEKFLQNSIPELNSSLHFRYYIRNICIKKCYEAYRECIDGKLIFIDDGNLIPENYISEDDSMDDWISTFEDVDVHNDSEVSQALAYILWERMDPYYTRLIEGIEAKVTIFLLHYVEGKSYEEIVKMYHSDLPKPLLNKWIVKYRQDMVRVRNLLKKRLIAILLKQ